MTVLSPNRTRPASKETTKPNITAFLPDFVRDAPSTPLISRDAYVAETGARLDAMQRDVQNLTHALRDATATIAKLTTDLEQVQRLQTYREADQRQMRDRSEQAMKLGYNLKARLDHIEAKSGGNYHGYATFEAVSKRLTELGELEESARSAARETRIAAALFCASLVLWTLTIY